MLASDRPLPIDLCPTCARPPRGPGLVCACGDYRFPADPWDLPDETRAVGLEGVRQARATLARARRLRPARDQLVA